jgi:hypothetical protein
MIVFFVGRAWIHSRRMNSKAEEVKEATVPDIDGINCLLVVRKRGVAFTKLGLEGNEIRK